VGPGELQVDGGLTPSARSEHGRLRGSLTLRVPAARFSALVDELETLGTVQSENVGTQDVTRAYTAAGRVDRGAHRAHRPRRALGSRDGVRLVAGAARARPAPRGPEGGLTRARGCGNVVTGRC
jgi:hypothetical protein